MVDDPVPDSIEYLKQEAEDGKNRHSPTADSLYHNGGTVIALALTGTATILPSSESTWARVAAAAATFVIAVSRGLNFGARWSWHLGMRNQYLALSDGIKKVAIIAQADRAAYIGKLYDHLIALRARESGIPGTGEPAA